MKFGVREICEVVLKAKAAQKVGNKIFYKGEPVIYFDTLKTSSMEGAATTVYAQGGRGNSRLVAWEGERTVTFTMEDALISPEGFMILSGAGLIEATSNKTIKQHMTERVDASFGVTKIDDEHIEVLVSNRPYFGEMRIGADGEAKFYSSKDDMAYVMFVKDGEIISEPYIPLHVAPEEVEVVTIDDKDYYKILVEKSNPEVEKEDRINRDYKIYNAEEAEGVDRIFSLNEDFDSVIVDYYVERNSHAMQIEITPDKFGGNYYLEASTLFRDTNGQDMPAEFIIPNCKIQSNFTFTMASSGDPSTFTFTMDAFPDYTRFDHSKKVLAAIQIIEDAASMDLIRSQTYHDKEDDKKFF